MATNQQEHTQYIDPPSIPAGLTITTYRELRKIQRARKVSGIRRISARKMVV